METRAFTKLLLAMVENGLDKDALILNLLNYMSESDVKDFCDQYGYTEESEEESEEK